MNQPISPLLQWSHAELKNFLTDSVPNHAALGLEIVDCGAGRLCMVIPYVERLAEAGGGIDPGTVTTSADEHAFRASALATFQSARRGSARSLGIR